MDRSRDGLFFDSNLAITFTTTYIAAVKGLLRIALLLTFVAGLATVCLTQEGPQSNKKGHVVMVSLFKPAYPPLARAARISGAVELKIGIRKDGRLESVVAASGHPMLVEAALTSARQSRFECHDCTDEVTSYSLTYSFQLPAEIDSKSESGEQVLQSGNRVAIIAPQLPAILDFSYISVRSKKCLYLWRCGSRWGGEDYYYVRVRSAKCLYLWNCALRRREGM